MSQVSTHLVLLLLTVLCTSASAQTTYYVTTDGIDDVARDGLSPATAWASLPFACEQVPGDVDAPDTIQIGVGTFVMDQTAGPNPGVTIQGMGADQTTLRSGPNYVQTNTPNFGDFPDYMISLAKFRMGFDNVPTTNVTIRNLRMESPLDNLRHGAILLVDVDDILIENLEVVDFQWAGIFLIACEDIEVRGCQIENANRVFDERWSGNINTEFILRAKFHNNEYRNTTTEDNAFGVGYKGRDQSDVQIYDSDFTTGTGFDIEIPFSQLNGVDIYNNVFNKTVSLPILGPADNPADRGFEYSVRIRDNYFTNGYDIEGPRPYMEVCNNFFDVQNDNGRCYAQFGDADVVGRNKIHHNVAVGIDRSFFWVNNGLDSVDFYNNTLYYESADDRASSMIDVQSSVIGWNIKNNLFVSPPEQPRFLGAVTNSAGAEVEANLVINALDAALPPGNFRDEDPGLRLVGPMPDVFYAPASLSSFVVDRGVDVGFPFEGAAPDIGAFEFSEALPIELLSFTGVAERKLARLTWSVGNVEAVSHFEVLELVGEEEVARSRVPYAVGRQTYVRDEPWASETTERSFRLRLVDRDGTARFSERIILRRSSAMDALHLSPNPAVGSVSFPSLELGAYRVYNATGQLAARGSLSVPTTSITVAGLPAGTYRVVVIGRYGAIRSGSFVR